MREVVEAISLYNRGCPPLLHPVGKAPALPVVAYHVRKAEKRQWR